MISQECQRKQAAAAALNQLGIGQEYLWEIKNQRISQDRHKKTSAGTHLESVPNLPRREEGKESKILGHSA